MGFIASQFTCQLDSEPAEPCKESFFPVDNIYFYIEDILVRSPCACSFIVGTIPATLNLDTLSLGSHMYTISTTIPGTIQSVSAALTLTSKLSQYTYFTHM